MRRVVCTTGTSILTNARRAVGNHSASLGNSRLIQEYLERLKADRQHPDSFFVKLCAETNSLSRVSLNPDDQIVLLHTETDDGRECAEAVRDVLQEELGLNVFIQSVEGLQINDPSRFRKVGLHNLFRILREQCVEWSQEDPINRKPILNATGGFKAVVPYLTLFGLIHRIDVIYTFEQSNTLIHLPPVPIQFDYERLGQARRALQLLRKEGVLPKEKFFAEIPGLPFHERTWYESLLEEDEAGYVTLSSFGFLVAEAWERDVKRIYLSPQAQEAYAKSSGDIRKRITHFLTVLQDPLWRNHHLHSFTGTDLQVYKMPHQAERIAGFVRGERLYVCLLYLSHDEYEKKLPGQRMSNFESSLNEFSPWQPPSEEYVLPSESPDEYQKLVEDYRELKNQFQLVSAKLREAEKSQHAAEDLYAESEKARESLEQKCQGLSERVKDLELKIQTSEGLRSQAETQNKELEEKNSQLEREVQELRTALAFAQRPWWRKFFGLPPVRNATSSS